MKNKQLLMAVLFMSIVGTSTFETLSRSRSGHGYGHHGGRGWGGRGWGGRGWGGRGYGWGGRFGIGVSIPVGGYSNYYDDDYATAVVEEPTYIEQTVEQPAQTTAEKYFVIDNSTGKPITVISDQDEINLAVNEKRKRLDYASSRNVQVDLDGKKSAPIAIPNHNANFYLGDQGELKMESWQ